MSIEVSGHTDNIGTHEFNQYLSQARANVVVAYLTSKGISRSKLSAKGYGENHPLASNENDRGRRLNRRAEFKVTKIQGAIADAQIAVIQTEENIEYLKWKVHFPFNEWAKITAYSQGKLMEVVNYLEENPSLKLRVHAHADPIGSYEYNRALSEKRAETVEAFLIAHGIAADRLVTKSFGENYPLVETENIQFNVKNRRIEFEVIK